MITILIADDHSIIRDGIKSLLKEDEGIQVIGEAASGKEVIEKISQQTVDLVLMDLNMPDMDGFEATQYLGTHYPEVKVLILTMLENEKFVCQVLQAGASGYILKNTGKVELTYAIRMVAEGIPYVSSQIIMNLLKKNTFSQVRTETASQSNITTPNNISSRELEVLKLISEGYTNAEAADKLFVSKRTVDAHRQNLIEKTNAKNTADLIRYAISKGLVN